MLVMDQLPSPELAPPLVLKEPPADLRLYVPHGEHWEAHIQSATAREYCHFKTPGQDYFHLLVPGEIYVQYGTTKFCLSCAYRLSHVTDDRLFWQNGVRKHRDPLL